MHELRPASFASSIFAAPGARGFEITHLDEQSAGRRHAGRRDARRRAGLRRLVALPALGGAPCPGRRGRGVGDAGRSGRRYRAHRRGAGRVAGAALDPTELEPDGLRPSRPGAPATRIHWPAVARTGDVIERRLAADASSRPLVVLDTRGPTSDGALDQAVRAAASLCVHLARGGGCALLLPGDRRATEVDPDMPAWHALHVRLALVGPGAAPAAGRLERGGEIYWVAPSAGSVPIGLGRAAAAPRRLAEPPRRVGGGGSGATGPRVLVGRGAGRGRGPPA